MGPLTDEEIATLARYNDERARGLVHTDDWRAAMAELQVRFDLMPAREVVERRERRLRRLTETPARTL